ncbi:hypothetical protein [Paenibacillus sp. FSL L8-0463]|uniref:hypothetical protein n=1 Tax=Paenibacillus sp. FSL L8-0463 TaxID=2954687 RepID=UPI003119194C
MRSVPFSGRLKLSEEAIKFYESHGKVPGGYTRLIEKSIEYYVNQGALSNFDDLKAIKEKLSDNDIQLGEIKNILMLATSFSKVTQNVTATPDSKLSSPERG